MWLAICYVLLDARPPVWSELAWQQFSTRWQAEATIHALEPLPDDVRCQVVRWRKR